MDRTFNKAANHKEAEKWDIKKQINMTPRQRQKIAYESKKRFYGSNPPNVRSIKNDRHFFFKRYNRISSSSL